MNLSTIRGVISDMDGVLWRGDEPLPGMTAFFDLMRTRAIPFVLATNNSSRTRADYVAKLAHLGIGGLQEAQIVTSGTTTVDYLCRMYPPGTRVHVLGGDGLKAMTTAAGFTLADSDARVVVAGIDFNLTYERLKTAAMLIRAGADFIGTNNDATFPKPEGLVPGAGSILAALRTATGREPRVMGKPGAPMFESALALLGTAAGETLMIGDRLDTDIVGADALGLPTALVLTGVTERAQLADSPVQPCGIYDGLTGLLNAWTQT
jgi:4-nitrophenyl phosphatase